MVLLPELAIPGGTGDELSDAAIYLLFLLRSVGSEVGENIDAKFGDFISSVFNSILASKLG